MSAREGTPLAIAAASAAALSVAVVTHGRIVTMPYDAKTARERLAQAATAPCVVLAIICAID
jgi:hypothetical protein